MENYAKGKMLGDAPLAAAFEKKYGFDGVKFVQEAGIELYGVIKKIGIKSALEDFARRKNYSVEINDAFMKDLIEVLVEAGERFPDKEKYSFDDENLVDFKLTPLFPSQPKSKGLLEDFKNIVSDDDLRPAMTGVYVDKEDEVLVATDAHKMVVFKNSTYQNDAGKIINLKKYLGTKGNKIEFIDATFPRWKQVVPTDNPNKKKHLSTYAFYNACYSTLAIKKYISNYVFNINFTDGENVFAFNPIILGETLAFALAKGFPSFDLEYSTPMRAFILRFEDEKGFKSQSYGLVMPIFAREDEKTGTEVYSFNDINDKFSIKKAGKKTNIPTRKATTSPTSPQKPTKRAEIPYKRYEGSLDDVTYIPRRDIAAIVLKNGQELTSAEIIDGIYRINAPKAAKGGMTSKEIMSNKMEKVMGEFKRGKLHSGSGAKVTKREQAIAIGLSEGRKAQKKH